MTACLLDCSKAFDKCRFDKLFSKLLERQLPAVVIRALIFIYEEQTACVRLAGRSSNTFNVSNGTRQGSLASPALFAVYLDSLLKQLRQLQLGCHVGGVWMGAASYCDDLILLSPTRSVLQDMLSVCEKYATEHNMVYSTDPNPSKSKTKCMYFCGNIRNVVYPAPVKLNGRDLPWVTSAEHLGHTLHQSCTMDQDIRINRAQYIEKTTEIRNTFSWAHTSQKLKASNIYVGDFYEYNIWQLNSSTVEMYFNS